MVEVSLEFPARLLSAGRWVPDRQSNVVQLPVFSVVLPLSALLLSSLLLPSLLLYLFVAFVVFLYMSLSVAVMYIHIHICVCMCSCVLLYCCRIREEKKDRKEPTVQPES